ncbi:MAG: Nif11-like leader peptide family RiPP precursor [Oscillospiraceae bacterium]|jgi:hypothetical protein|nr:Nif11-like leader peptide family RiPP precursor [Oscillospiraceae bacterium]
MSKFTEFYAKLQSDEAIKSAFIKAAKDNGVKEGTPFTDLSDGQLNALIPAAKDAGFDFTLVELKDYLSKKKAGELSDDELEAVAGGTTIKFESGDPSAPVRNQTEPDFWGPCPNGISF